VPIAAARPRRWTHAVAAGLITLCTLAQARADSATDGTTPEQERRGPPEIRDDHLLAQPRLTLPAVSPDTTAAGRWSLALSALWSNSFSWSQSAAGETPDERLFLIDGEALTLDAHVRRGLTKQLDVGLRVPLRWRGGGAMDSLIDAWHRLGFPNGDRPSFRENAFRVEGRTTASTPFYWNDSTGAGLGDVELESRWRFADGGANGPSATFVTRLSLPTATGPFDGQGLGGAAQLALGAPLGRRVDLYLGAGTTVQAPGPVRAIEYETTRIHGFLALEWRPWRRLSLVAETNAASRLVANIEGYPGLHWVLNVTGRVDLGARTRLDLGFTENFESQLTTTDFALHAAVALRP